MYHRIKQYIAVYHHKTTVRRLFYTHPHNITGECVLFSVLCVCVRSDQCAFVCVYTCVYTCVYVYVHVHAPPRPPVFKGIGSHGSWAKSKSEWHCLFTNYVGICLRHHMQNGCTGWGSLSLSLFLLMRMSCMCMYMSCMCMYMYG